MDLFVQTSYSLFRLDLKNYQFDPAAASISGEIPPIPHVCLRYDDDVLPLVRNVMKLRSKVYFFGRASKKIYEYDPSKNSMEETDFISNNIKDEPAVEEIGGKIYVFDTIPNPYYSAGMNLEVLDPSSPNLSWEQLFDPEFNRCFIHFVLRYKLYIFTGQGKMVYYFDTRRIKWGTKNDMFKYKPHFHDSLMFPSMGRRVCEDIIVALKAERKFRVSRCFVYGYLYSKDDCLLKCQNLGDVFGEHELDVDSSRLIDMAEGRFCVVAVGTSSKYRCFHKPVPMDPDMMYSGPTYCRNYVIGVSVFSVRKLANDDELAVKEPTMPPNADVHFVKPDDPTPKEEEFLSLSIGKNYFFDTRSLWGLSVKGAFLA